MKFLPKNWDFGCLFLKNQMTAKIMLNLHRFQVEVVLNKWQLCTELPKKCCLNCRTWASTFGNVTHSTISSYWQCAGRSLPSTQLYPHNISHQSISDSRTWGTSVQTAWSMYWKHHGSMEWTSVRSKPWAFNMLGKALPWCNFPGVSSHLCCLSGAPSLMVVRFGWMIWKILVMA